MERFRKEALNSNIAPCSNVLSGYQKPQAAEQAMHGSVGTPCAALLAQEPFSSV